MSALVTFFLGFAGGVATTWVSHVFTKRREDAKEQREIAGKLQELIDQWMKNPIMGDSDFLRETERYLTRLNSQFMATRIRDATYNPHYTQWAELTAPEREEFYEDQKGKLLALSRELGRYFRR